MFDCMSTVEFVQYGTAVVTYTATDKMRICGLRICGLNNV